MLPRMLQQLRDKLEASGTVDADEQALLDELRDVNGQLGMRGNLADIRDKFVRGGFGSGDKTVMADVSPDVSPDTGSAAYCPACGKRR